MSVRRNKLINIFPGIAFCTSNWTYLFFYVVLYNYVTLTHVTETDLTAAYFGG